MADETSTDTSNERRRRSRGATAVEYGLLVALIAGLILAGVAALGNKTNSLYKKTDNEMTNAGM